jgi:hypothetical protein
MVIQRFPFCFSKVHEHEFLPLSLLSTYIYSEINGTYDDRSARYHVPDDILERLRSLACETLEYADDGSITLVSWSDGIILIEEIGASADNLKSFLASHEVVESSVARWTKKTASSKPSFAFPTGHRHYNVGIYTRGKPDLHMDALENAVKSGDIVKIHRELEQVQFGFAVRRLEGKNMLLASNGHRFPLHSKAKKWNQVHDGKALLSFVIANADPGKVRCPRCHEWFDSYVEERFDYAPCLGYCDTAKRVGKPIETYGTRVGQRCIK